MTNAEAREYIKVAVEFFGITPDEVVHELVDAGEIDSSQHAELLSPKESKRIYGD